MNDNMALVYAFDGKISTHARKNFFHSEKEDNPWLEMTMPEGYVRGVFIFTRYAYEEY